MPTELKRFWLVLLLVGGAAAVAEGRRWIDPQARAEALSGWLCGRPADVTPFLPLLLLAPVAAGIGARRGSIRPWTWMEEGPGSTAAAARLRAFLLSGFCAALALTMSLRAGSRFEGWPPASHDEFSYLLQAQTFAAGRTSFPSFSPHGEIFDQMHVLNEGRFASRYFPGTGAWLLPFVRLGRPELASPVAFGLLAFFVFWTGRRLANNGVGLLAGTLCGLSPGLILFSNTLLAHLPTLAGLGLFLVAIVHFREALRPGWGLAAGIGLAFAMLCRPMTAAGFALPWGVWFAWVLVTGRGPGASSPAAATPADSPATTPRLPIARRVLLALALGGPLIVGVVTMMFYNRSITGRMTLSPYQLYTDTYTPRHVYGFNNVVRGEKSLGPKVLENYDRWAENLTPALAARNVGRRTVASLRGTLAIIPLSFALLWLAFGLRSLSTDWRLVLAAVISLHLVHIPYWFEGIMGWHYVFESAPLLLLLLAEATRQIKGAWRNAGVLGMVVWWNGLMAIAVAVNLTTVPPLWPGALRDGLAELGFSRRKYAEVETLFRDASGGRPTVIFIEPDPSDRHIDYVYNTPDLQGPILRARYRPDRDRLEELVALFPDREPFLFRAASGELRRIPR